MKKLISVINETKQGVYFTSKSETLYDVEERFNVPIRLIMLENGVTSLDVSNRALCVKKRSNLYTVKPTDTIKNLQEKFAVSVETLYNINKTKYFYPGQKILTKDE